MTPILQALAAFIQNLFRSRQAMQMEILALRHQLAVYQRTGARPRPKPADRLLWSWLSLSLSRSPGRRPPCSSKVVRTTILRGR